MGSQFESEGLSLQMSALQPSVSWLEFTQLMNLSVEALGFIWACELNPSNFLPKLAKRSLVFYKKVSIV